MPATPAEPAKTPTEKSRKKTSSRKNTSATRLLLLDAAEALMREQGYAAVTSRRLGERAGVASPLIHYHFDSMDDLFVQLYRRRAEEGLARVENLLKNEDVPQALWQLSFNPVDGIPLLEYMSLATHRQSVQDEMKKHALQYRQMQRDALARYLERNDIELPMDPDVLMILMSSVGFLAMLQSESGETASIKKARAYIDSLIHSLENNQTRKLSGDSQERHDAE